MLEDGDQEGALALLQTISDYGNASGYINQILYDRAMTQMDQGEYESAVALLRQVGEYQDAVSQLTRSLTNAAQARIENGQYEQRSPSFPAKATMTAKRCGKRCAAPATCWRRN